MTNDGEVTAPVAADAVKTLRLYMTQLARTAVANSECPSIAAEAHFTVSVAGLQGDGKTYGGHEMSVWVHMDGWAESVNHPDPARLIEKAGAMAAMLDELNSLRQRVPAAAE